MDYVVGFLFKDDQVLLLEKTKPIWQKGKLNGIGGKIEFGETSLEAMEREFKEETGCSVKNWRMFCKLNFRGGIVDFFVSHDTTTEPKSVTEEQVAWYDIDQIKSLPTIQNLRWLIPMALDKDDVEAVVIDNS